MDNSEIPFDYVLNSNPNHVFLFLDSTPPSSAGG